MKKLILSIIGLFLLLAGIGWMLTSFIYWNGNPNKWEESARVVVGIMVMAIWFVLSTVIVGEYIEKQKTIRGDKQ